MPLFSRDSRPSTSDGHSIASSSLGTKRRFPLLGRKRNRAPELTRPATALPPSSRKSGFRVHVDVKFESPLLKKSNHARDYDASPALVASDRLCQALFARLQHCSAELITRHDCGALDPLRKPHRDVKPLRYRITYRVERDGQCLVEKSLRSFQEYDLTADDAREVIAATDRTVGLFLLRHDSGFRWVDESEKESFNVESETLRPCTGRPQSTCCVPRSRFVPNTQTFELIPGYSIELFLRSRCATRYPENRNASIKIDSSQPTPLTLLLGEDLATRVSNLLIDPVDSYKRKFDRRHKSCAGLEGSGGCQHVEDGAVDIMVKVRNNLGPDYNYFSHRVQTSKVLFNDPRGSDFDEFTNQLKAKLEKARDMSDKAMRSMDDLTIRIRELRGNGWSVHEPLSFRLDPTVTYCRQTVEAIMERLQAGISNVLEGHEEALATMTAHKRGHLIYDGFLDGAGGDDEGPCQSYGTPDLERRVLESRLRERIRTDITMLCKDTCALDCKDLLPNLKVRGGDSASSVTSVPRSSVVSSAPRSSVNSATRRRSSVSTAPRLSSINSSLPRPSSEISIAGSSASTRSDHTLSKKQAQQNLRSEASVEGAELTRVPSGVEMAKRYGYMADYIADDENLSEPPSTPSLADTNSISPRESLVVTPQSTKAASHDQSNHGLRIVDDGRRIIYEERSDMEAYENCDTEIHHYQGEDEVATTNKGQPLDTPAEKRRSFDTRMPDLSGNADTNRKLAVVPQEADKVVEDVRAQSTPAAEPIREQLPHEGVLEYVREPASPVTKDETLLEKAAEQSTETLVKVPDAHVPQAKIVEEPTQAPPPVPEAQIPEAKPAMVVAPENSVAELPLQVSPISTTKQELRNNTNPESSQDETWELVEASNASNPTSTLTEVLGKEKPGARTESNLESSIVEPTVKEVADSEAKSADESDISPPRETEDTAAADFLPIQQNVDLPQVAPLGTVDAVDTEAATQELVQKPLTEETTVTRYPDVEAEEYFKGDLHLEDFPKPPHSENSFHEDHSHEELVTKSPLDEHVQTQESASAVFESLATDVEKQPEVSVAPEQATESTKFEDRLAGRRSVDSAISMEERTQSLDASDAVEASEAVAYQLAEPEVEEYTVLGSIAEAVEEPDDESESYRAEEMTAAVSQDSVAPTKEAKEVVISEASEPQAIDAHSYETSDFLGSAVEEPELRSEAEAAGNVFPRPASIKEVEEIAVPDDSESQPLDTHSYEIPEVLGSVPEEPESESEAEATEEALPRPAEGSKPQSAADSTELLLEEDSCPDEPGDSDEGLIPFAPMSSPSHRPLLAPTLSEAALQQVTPRPRLGSRAERPKTTARPSMPAP
ncbi:hypothetical protein G7046_g7924 [Stylonectria norvegica]|nr:hypothetical protein G7046_g7924 [Stylonectria norvegica]